MKPSRVLSVLPFLLLTNCAKPVTDERPIDDLTVYVYASKISGDTTSCYVDFRDPQNGNNYYVLLPEDMVACDGIATTAYNGGWQAQFQHPGTDPVRVTIIRPGAGTVLIKYAELQ